MWAQLVGFRLPPPQDTSLLPSQARHGRPTTRAAGHAHADLGPHGARGWGGGFEHSESRLLPKSIGILSPHPRPPSPALEVTTAGADTHPPQLTHVGPPPFPQPQPAAGAGGLLPLPPSWSPSHWCSASPAPFCGERWGLGLDGVLPPEQWGLPLEWMGMWSPRRR